MKARLKEVLEKMIDEGRLFEVLSDYLTENEKVEGEFDEVPDSDIEEVLKGLL